MNMKQKQDNMVNQLEQVEPRKVTSWAEGLEELHAYIGPRFARSEQRERALAYLKALLNSPAGKSSWQIAEMAGEASPYGMQRLLSSSLWDADALRDDMQSYLVRMLGNSEAVTVIDEIFFPKKGNKSVGVVSGSNCQIGVFLAYSSVEGHALLDRELYLDLDWIEDVKRRAQVKVPANIRLSTRPQLALQMLKQAQYNDISTKWVVSCSVDYDDTELRLWLEAHKQSYILPATFKSTGVIEARSWRFNHTPFQVDQESLPLEEILNLNRWTRKILDKSKPGWNIWHLIYHEPSFHSLARDEWPYRVFAPSNTTLEEMVLGISQCVNIKRLIQRARKEVGLDHYEVRSWRGWYRHITLSMLALAFIAAMQAQGVVIGS